MTLTVQFDLVLHAAEARLLDIHPVPEAPRAAPGAFAGRVASTLRRLLRLDDERLSREPRELALVEPGR